MSGLLHFRIDLHLVKVVQSVRLVFEDHVVVLVLEGSVDEAVEGFPWEVFAVCALPALSVNGGLHVLKDLLPILGKLYFDDFGHLFLLNKELIENLQIRVKALPN